MEQLVIPSVSIPRVKSPVKKRLSSGISRSNGKSYTNDHTPPKKVLITVTDHAPDVICRFDRKYRLLYVNPAIEKTTGIPKHMFLHKTTRELGMPEEHSRDWEQGVSYVFKTGEQTAIEFPFLTPKGIRHFHSKLVPEHNDAGEIETVLSISRDITELKEQDKHKEEVVGFVSHELKTPLTTLKIFAQMLQQKFTKSGDTHTAEHLAKMDTQINKLTNIIGDLTEATRIENNTMKMQMQRFDFHTLVKELTEDIQKTSLGHTIRLDMKGDSMVRGDKFRIGQVVTNLLTNAIKYSPNGSDIFVSVYTTPKTIICKVKDHGIGISKPKQKKIFERFFRVQDSQSKENLGLGLGLFIASEIMKMHKGKIQVASTPGKGSTFSISLPRV